jgi:hypothetical protein
MALRRDALQREKTGSMTTFKLPEGAPKKAKPKKLHERESIVEEHLRKVVQNQGGIAYKFTSPQRRSVPDRLVLRDVAKAAHTLRGILALYGVSVELLTEEALEDSATAIVAEMVHFVELKATGAKPTELQLREHAKLRALGFKVDVIDSKAKVNAKYPK